MGTRNMTVVIAGGKTCVEQYGQWDGYPDGQGKTVLEFLADENNRSDRMSETFQKVEELTEKQRVLCDDFIKSTGLGVAEIFPSLTRDTGAKILDLVKNSHGEIKVIHDKHGHGGGNAQYAYVIDYDRKVFGFYNNCDKAVEGGYWAEGDGVSLVKEYLFDALPTVKDLQMLNDNYEDLH